jgi:hypothetical protein
MQKYPLVNMSDLVLLQFITRNKNHHWQNSPFLSQSLPKKILPDLFIKLDHQVLTSLDFTAVIFLQSRVVSFASNPQPGGPGSCIYVPEP